jgi:type IV secretory pathway VirD2 relaxase
MVGIALEYLDKMGYQNTQFIIARHHDTDHPHIHLVINRIDNDGKRISDKNERFRSTQVCMELTKKYGLYIAKGKENVKRHRLKEPDKTKYEIYDAI